MTAPEQLTLLPLAPVPTHRLPAEAAAAVHAANPHVMEALASMAIGLKRDSGWAHGSINLLFSRLRWRWAVQTKGDSYKLNNSHRAWYSRELMARFPYLDGWFETRQRPTEEE